ncbi:MAG: aminoacetone oxidase family FAD-binding enzyme [Anaerovoracaceae bacterium]
MKDVIIIGGGAAGLAVSSYISLENKDMNILLIEKKDQQGKKVAASGNGRCNISNVRCRNIEETINFFHKLGIEIQEDLEGRYYPKSNKAKDVVKALSYSFKNENINLKLNENVEKIEKIEDCFVVKTNKNEYKGKNVVIATGGKSSPGFGSTGDGYSFAKKLGHSVNKLSPVLTSMEGNIPGSFAGVRAKGIFTLYQNRSVVFSEPGEVQFTKDGISGICVFNGSRFLSIDENTSFRDYKASVDFFPETHVDQLKELIFKRLKDGRLSYEDTLLTMVNEQIARFLLDQFAELSFEEIAEEIGKKLKCFEINITGASGWKNAQCTKGGIPLEEVFIDSSMSKIVDGLYFAGEILDFDGPCGGFNLQNAWDTAIKVGRKICIEYTK